MKSILITFVISGVLGIGVGYNAKDYLDKEFAGSDAGTESGPMLHEIAEHVKRMNTALNRLSIMQETAVPEGADSRQAQGSFVMLYQFDQLLERNRKQLGEEMGKLLESKLAGVKEVGAGIKPVATPPQIVTHTSSNNAQAPEGSQNKYDGMNCGSVTTVAQQNLFNNIKSELPKTDFAKYADLEDYLSSVEFDKLGFDQQQEIIGDIVHLSAKNVIPQTFLSAGEEPVPVR